MVRELLKWIDKKGSEAVTEQDHVMVAKAISLGLLEGVIDGAVVVGLIATFVGLTKQNK